MKINGISNYSYSNINNNKQYSSRPVFKQNQTAGIVPTAILDTFVEAANEKDKSTFKSKINFLKNVLFSDQNTKQAQQLKEVLDSYEDRLYTY